mmetsp:Transcript_18077/g.24411  ORF Transcript_18077/g.24411 Transcript_18077/m.24411 type:complete len:116 (-) Transcript_18077:122-469(-)
MRDWHVSAARLVAINAFTAPAGVLLGAVTRDAKRPYRSSDVNDRISGVVAGCLLFYLMTRVLARERRDTTNESRHKRTTDTCSRVLVSRVGLMAAGFIFMVALNWSHLRPVTGSK